MHRVAFLLLVSCTPLHNIRHGIVAFICNVDGKIDPAKFYYPRDTWIGQLNPDPTKGLEPGRKQTYFFPFADFSYLRKRGESIFPIEIQVIDEIGNKYSEKISDEIGDRITKVIYASDE